jgi:hypothetical protein
MTTEHPGDFDVPDVLADEEAAMPAPADDPLPMSPAEGASARHAPSLMAIPGVVGVAAGRTQAGAEAIVVYLEDAAARDRLPPDVDGFPVEAEVTGRIDAY